MSIFLNGLTTGLVLQLAIGPVFFFIINLALQRAILDGFAAVLAVTLVDYLYITLSIIGIGKLLEKKKVKKAFGIVSSIVLIIFGVLIVKSIFSLNPLSSGASPTNLFESFAATFFLTISSPMTIVWYTSLFSAKAVEYNYTKRELLFFGLAVGLATFIFMGSSVILFSLIKKTVPILIILILNALVGGLLITYGSVRLVKVLKNSV